MEFKTRKVYNPEIDACMQRAVQAMPGNPANVSFWANLKERFPALNDFSADSLRSHWTLIKNKQNQSKKKNKIRLPTKQNPEPLIHQQKKSLNIDSRINQSENIKERVEEAELKFDESTNYESDRETEKIIEAKNIVYEIGNGRDGGNIGNIGENKRNGGENRRKEGAEGKESERKELNSIKRNDLLISEEKIMKSNERVMEKQDVIECFYDLVDLCSFFYGKKIQEKQVLDVLITMHGSVKETVEYFKRDHN